MRTAVKTGILDDVIRRVEIALTVSPVASDRKQPAWDEAHTAIKDARREWLRTTKRAGAQWLDECLADVPGLSERHAAICKVESVRQFVNCYPTRLSLDETKQIGALTVDEIQSALAAIGVAWPKRY